jgi:hypothetical protein
VTLRRNLTASLIRLHTTTSRITTKHRVILFGMAGVAFVVGCILAWQSLPTDLGTFEWWPLMIVAIIGVPLTIALNAVEYKEVAGLVGLRVGVTGATRTAVLGTAANMAPLPGALLVRWGDMTRRGSQWGASINANLVAGTIWLASSAATLAILTSREQGIVFWVALALCLTSAFVSGLLVRATGFSLVRVSRLGIIEVGVLMVTALRALLIITAFALPGGFPTALAIASTYALSSFIGIFPAGLGLREVLSGVVVYPAAGGLSTGFIVSAVDRLIGLAVHAPLALLLSLGRNDPGKASTGSQGGLSP